MADGFEENEAFERTVTPGPTRYEEYKAGVLTVDDWDDEELERGQMRGRDGRFHGARPRMMDAKLYQEWQRRLRQHGQNELETSLMSLLRNLVRIATDPTIPTELQLRATTYGIDRVMGKTAERVDVQVTDAAPWQGVFARIAREVPAVEAAVVDAEVVEP